jgi:hypothetical protein
MNRWSKIVIGVGVLASLGWIAGGLLGPGAGRSPENLARHTQVVYGATLLWILADVWILIFLAGSTRALRRALSGSARTGDAGVRHGVVALGVGAAVLVVAQFAVSSELFPGHLDARLHLATALAALVLQLAFLIVGGRELARHHRLQRALEAAV